MSNKLKFDMIGKIKAINDVGKKYGNLTILEFIGSREDAQGIKKNWVKCQCDCTRVVEYPIVYIRNGSIKTCGFQPCKKSGKIDDIKMYRIVSAKFVYSSCYNDGDISFEKFMELSQLPCYYCGTTNYNSFNRYNTKRYKSLIAKENGWFYYNGLDRIDSSKKHLLVNSIPCCGICNWMKCNLLKEDFILHINKILNYLERDQ